MRVGILGGTFDPPHLGHLLAAVDVAERLTLDRLILVPAAQQPLKVGAVNASAADRLEMTRLLVEGDARFEVDPIEIERPGLSYTVDTLAAYAARYPSAERFFLAGEDVLRTFERWREPALVLQLATLVVMTRDDGGETGGVPENAVRVPTRRIDISSTEIRSRVAEGRSLRGFVPESVADYIAARGLYREGTAC